jgi:hypothetical protein
MSGSPSSDIATLSTVRTQLAELEALVESIAGTYGDTPDSAVASALYAAERALITARRSADKAVAALAELRPR